MSSTASIANSSFLVSRIMMGALSRRRPRPGSRFTPRRRVGTSGSDSARAEAARLPRAGLGKLADNAEFGAGDPGEHQLGDAVAGIDPDALVAVVGTRRVAVPRRDEAGALVIGVDQPDRIAEHQPVAMAEPRSRQHQRTPFRIADAKGDAGRDQHGWHLRP